MRATPRDYVERAARVYRMNTDAASSLGITPGSFARMCRQHGIETPYVRRQRERREVLNMKARDRPNEE